MEKLGSLLCSARITLVAAEDAYNDALNYQNQGNLDRAQACYLQALDVAQKAHTINPNRSKVSRSLAAIYLNYGRFLQVQNRVTQAEEAYKKAQEYGQQADTLKPNHPKVQTLLKDIHFHRSQFLRAQGHLIQADQALGNIAAQGFASSSNVVPSQRDLTQGSPSYFVNNPAFNTHLSTLSPCVSPFFTQSVQRTASSASYVLPQSQSIESIQNTHYLAWCIQNDQAPAADKATWTSLAKKVVEQFKQTKVKTLASIQELVALATVDDPELHRTITNAFLDALKPEKNRLLSLPLLRGLSAMVLHRRDLTQDIHSVGDSVTLLRAVLEVLKNIHVDSNQEQAQTLLHTLSLLLDQMVYLGIKELDRITIQEPLQSVLNRLADQKKYPELVWPITYIQQALARLPNNERFSEALIRRALPILGGLSYLTTFGLKIASAEVFISGFEPDKLWEAYNCFKEAFNGVAWLKERPWYGELCFIDVLIGVGKLDLLGMLLAQNKAPREMHYLHGLCDRLERIACMHDEVDARDDALRMLSALKEGKIAWAQDASIPPYASQSLNRVALMWPTPDTAAMERNGYAPAAWHPFWAKQSSAPLLGEIQSKARRRAKQEAMQYQITAITSHNAQMERLLPATISQTDLRTALYQYYQLSNLSIPSISGETVSLKDCYINLAIVESQAQREADKKALEKQATVFERLPSSERQQLEATNLNKLIALENLFDAQKLRDGSEGIPKRILIQGRAGSGKTTLCKKLVYDYQNSSLWQDQFDSVLWVPLRQLKTHAPKRLEDLLCTQYFAGYESSQAQALSKVFYAHQDKTLFILDGLDEVAGELNEGQPLKDFLQTLLNQAHVVITSRPAGVDTKLLGQLDLELETVGFSSANVEAYIEKFVPEQNRAAILQFIRRTPLIQGLVNIPIQLGALCYSWDRLPENQEVTMSMLYEAMVDKLWRKDSVRLEKKEEGKILGTGVIDGLSKSDIEELMAAEIHYLGYLAFKGLETEKIEFSSEELSQRRKELNISTPTWQKLPVSFTTNMKKTSYLHTADAHRPESERQYYFLHLTFQEFFAAKFLAAHLQMYTPVEKVSAHIVQKDLGVMPKRKELEAFIATHKYNPRYEIVWWMVAGLLKGAALENFFQILRQSPRDLIGMRHQQVILGCLNEARAQLKAPTLLAQLEKECMQWLDFEIENGPSDYSRLGSQRIFPEHLLLERLSQAEGEKKKKVIATLGARPVLSTDAVQALISSLKENGDVRVAAAYALRKQRTLSSDVVQTLISFLKDKNGDVRGAAAYALGNQSTLSSDAVQALISSLKDEDKDVRDMAAIALSKQRTLSSDAVQALISSLKDEHEDVRDAAAKALNSQSMLSLDAIQALISSFRDKSRDVRRAAHRALSYQLTLSSDAFQALISSFKDETASIREMAVDALSYQLTLSLDMVQALISSLKDENEDVRKMAALSLLSHPLHKPCTFSSDAVQALISSLKDENKYVRDAIAEALGCQSTLSSDVVQALISFVKDDNEDIRKMAACALRGQSTLSSDVVQTLISFLKDKNGDVREAAAYALGNQSTLSSDAVQALISSLKDEKSDVRVVAAYALRNQSTLSSDAVQTLISCLKDEHEDVRSTAAAALSRQSTLSSDLVQAFISCLKDKNSGVRDAAAEALALQSTLSLDLVQALISSFKDSGNGGFAVARALGSRSALSSDAIQALISSLKDEELNVRRKAAIALGNQSPWSSDAIQALISSLKDEEKSVREEVAGALGSNMNQLFTLLARLDQNQVEVLYTKFLFPRSCEQITPLYIQDKQLHFYTATGPGQPIPLTAEQKKSMMEAFKAVQVKAGITQLLEEELVAVDE